MKNDGREGFVNGLYWVDGVVIEHDVFEVEEGGDFLFLADVVDYFLCFCQHVVDDYLFCEDIDDSVVIDAVGVAFEVGLLAEAETFLKSELDAI